MKIMKIPLHLLILAALCFGLCACNETGNPENTADSEDLTSASAVQTEDPASHTEASPDSAPQTEDLERPFFDIQSSATLTPIDILSGGLQIRSVVNSPDFYADGCDPATVKETVYSIKPELFTNISEGGDTISILYPVIDIPDAPEFAEALNQEIRDFMLEDVSFPECELGYMHRTGTFAITWADRTHFSIACFQNYLYQRSTNFWYGVTVDVATQKKLTLSDLSMTAEKFDALLSDPYTQYDEILDYYIETSDQLKAWVRETLKLETTSNFFIASIPIRSATYISSIAKSNSLYIILRWPYCFSDPKEVVIKVPFEFEEQSESDSAQAQ